MKVLQHQFFPTKLKIDLLNLPTFSYPDELAENEPIIEKEIRQALAKILSGKALRRSGITSDFLKLIKDFLVKAIIYLA